MNGGATVAEKLGINSEVHELKFGSSFTGNGKGASFHTIRYDFKPASTNTKEMATLEVGTNNQVTITVPHSDGSGMNVFKGARKPYTKDCVLIIDPETGEFTLEKLTHNIIVKKTREEGGSRIGNKGPPMAPTAHLNKPGPSPCPPPIPTVKIEHANPSRGSLSNKPREREEKKSHPNHPMLNPSSSSSSNNGRGLQSRPRSPMISSLPNKNSPHGTIGISPGRSSSPHLSNFDMGGYGKPQHQQPPSFHPPPPPLPSLASFEDFLKNEPPFKSPPEPCSYKPSSKAPPPNSRKTVPEPSQKHEYDSQSAKSSSLLSESSSGDSSSSSSSDDSSDDDMEVVDDIPVPKLPSPRPHTMPYLAPSKPSMPTHLLTEDLQLSESGSDSD